MASAQTVKIDGKDISIPTGLFINNEFVKSKEGNVFDVENPANGEKILSIQEGRADDVDIAVKAARTAFKKKEWKEINPMERAAMLIRLADIMEAHKDELIAIEMLDTGKTYKQASNLDIPASIATLRYYAGWADKVLGVSSFNVPKTFAYTQREPLGVCGQIIPWK